MAARTSSAEGGTPAEYSLGVAGLRDYLETWKARLAKTDWTPVVNSRARGISAFFSAGHQAAAFR